MSDGEAGQLIVQKIKKYSRILRIKDSPYRDVVVSLEKLERLVTNSELLKESSIELAVKRWRKDEGKAGTQAKKLLQRWSKFKSADNHVQPTGGTSIDGPRESIQPTSIDASGDSTLKAAGNGNVRSILKSTQKPAVKREWKSPSFSTTSESDEEEPPAKKENNSHPDHFVNVERRSSSDSSTSSEFILPQSTSSFQNSESSKTVPHNSVPPTSRKDAPDSVDDRLRGLFCTIPTSTPTIESAPANSLASLLSSARAASNTDKGIPSNERTDKYSPTQALSDSTDSSRSHSEAKKPTEKSVNFDSNCHDRESRIRKKKRKDKDKKKKKKADRKSKDRKRDTSRSPERKTRERKSSSRDRRSRSRERKKNSEKSRDRSRDGHHKKRSKERSKSRSRSPRRHPKSTKDISAKRSRSRSRERKDSSRKKKKSYDRKSPDDDTTVNENGGLVKQEPLPSCSPSFEPPPSPIMDLPVSTEPPVHIVEEPQTVVKQEPNLIHTPSDLANDALVLPVKKEPLPSLPEIILPELSPDLRDIQRESTPKRKLPSSSKPILNPNSESTCKLPECSTPQRKKPILSIIPELELSPVLPLGSDRIKKKKKRTQESIHSSPRKQDNINASPRQSQKKPSHSVKSRTDATVTSQLDSSQSSDAGSLTIAEDEQLESRNESRKSLGWVSEMTPEYRVIVKKKEDKPTSSGPSLAMEALTSKRTMPKIVSSRSKNLQLQNMRGVPSLHELCIRVLIANVDLIDEVGCLPFDVLKPVLKRCSPVQLLRIESLNPHLVEDTDQLWEGFCLREFKLILSEREEEESWCEFYVSKCAAREEKLKTLSEKVSTNKKLAEEPLRKTKLAFTDGPVKPPCDIQRAQKKNLTGANDVIPSRSQILARRFPATQGPSRAAAAAGRKSDQLGTISPTKRVGPLMLKTVKQLKNLY